MPLTRIAESVIYQDPDLYVHNPVVEQLPDGTLLCVFRQARRRRLRVHIDTSSVAAMVTSRDGGRTWDPASKRIFFQRDGWGVQDPSIRRLRDGTLICNFFVWVTGGQDEFPLDCPWLQIADADHFSWILGAYSIRSTDGGKSWGEPVKVNSPTGDNATTSDPVVELADGDLLMPIESWKPGETIRTMVARSRDGGRSWGDCVTTAFDPLGVHHFHETGLVQLRSGKVIAMHRCHKIGEPEYGQHLYQSDSEDGGRTWSQVRKTNVWGHPANMIQLQSGKVLLVYGHRRPPFGVRACLSHDEGKTWDIANEFILRNDGIDKDVGYPTSVQRPDGTIFTAWYMTRKEPGTQAAADHFFSYASPQSFLGGTLYREM